jgi:hypothetical protein
MHQMFSLDSLPYSYDKGIDKLLQVMQIKSWVQYSQYISYMFLHKVKDYENMISVCGAKRMEIALAQSDEEVENLINRQTSQTWGQLSELISNGIDASIESLEIGRFGIGFKQVLHELKNGARILVLTRTKGAPYGRIIEFAYHDSKVYIRDVMCADIEVCGTQIIVKRQLSNKEQAEIEDYVKRKYNRCLYAQVKFNSKIINDFSKIKDIATDSIECMEEKEVNVVVHCEGYEVRDYGTGMTDEVIYNHFLMPRQSTKKSVQGGEGLYYKLRDKENQCLIKFVVSGVTIEEHVADELDLPAEVIIYLPYMTQLSSARSEVVVNECLLRGLENIVISILEQECQKDFRLILINSIVTALKIFSQSTRCGGQEREYIEVIKSKIRYGLLAILEPHRIYLPRIHGCKYFKLNTNDVSFLDPTIYPEKMIEKIPGIERIQSIESDRYKAYSMTFNSELSPPVYLDFGGILVFDRNIYEFYKDTPEVLNLMLNYWIGYGGKPRLKGIFVKEKLARELVSDHVTMAEVEEDLLQEREETSQALNFSENTHEKKEKGKKLSLIPVETKKKTKNIDEKVAQLVKEVVKKCNLIEEKTFKKSISLLEGRKDIILYFNQFLVFVIDKKIKVHIESYIRNKLINEVSKDMIRYAVVQFLEEYHSFKISNRAKLNKNEFDNIKNFELDGETVWWLGLQKGKWVVYQNGKPFGATIEFDAIEYFQIVAGKTWWAGKESGKWTIYCDANPIATEFEEIAYFKILDEKIRWVGQKDNKWFFYKDEVLREINLVSIIEFFFTAAKKSIWWLSRTDNKYSVYKDGIQLGEDVDAIDSYIPYIIHEGVAWWLGEKNNRWCLFRNGKMIADDFNAVDYFFLSGDFSYWHDNKTGWVIYQGEEQIGAGFDCIQFISASGDTSKHDTWWIGEKAEKWVLYRNKTLVNSGFDGEIRALVLSGESIFWTEAVCEEADWQWAIYCNGKEIASKYNEIKILSASPESVLWIGQKGEENYFYENQILKFIVPENVRTIKSITLDWLRKIEEKPKECWRDYWLLYDMFSSLSVHKIRSDYLLFHWEIFYGASEVRGLVVKIVEKLKVEAQKFEFLLSELPSPLTKTQSEVAFATILTINDAEEQERYLLAVFLYGNFKLVYIEDEHTSQKVSIFAYPCVQLAIRCMGTNFASYLECRYITSDWLIQISKISATEEQWKLFWIILADFKGYLHSHEDFLIVIERLKIICFDLKDELKIEELKKLTESNKLNTIHGFFPSSECVSEICLFLSADIEAIHGEKQILIINFIGYFLWCGDQYPSEIFKELALKIGAAVLGSGLGWYQEQGYMNEVWLTNKIKEFGIKSHVWWKRYWDFFALLQGLIPNQEIFNQLSERWDILCKVYSSMTERQEGEDNELSYFLKQIKQHNWVTYLVNECKEEDLPEEIETYIKFFQEKNISLVEEEIESIETEKTTQPVVIPETIEKFSLSNLLLYCRKRNTARTIGISELKNGLVVDAKADDFAELSAKQKKKIQSVIMSQSGVRYLWIREVIQNNTDVIRKTRKKSKAEILKSELNETKLCTIEIAHYYRKVQMGDEFQCQFIIAVHDNVGMNLWEITHLLLNPGSSDPEKKGLQLVGEFGIGFFTIFTDADIVEVRTGTGEDKSYEVKMEVIRDDFGKIVDIAVSHLREFNDSYKGTEVRHVKVYKEQESILGHVEALFLKNRIEMFIEGLLAPVVTYKKGNKEYVQNKSIFTVLFNGKKFQPMERELCASIPVCQETALGNIKIYKRQGRTNKVEQRGLFVSGLKRYWVSYVPEIFQQQLTQGIGVVIELPKHAKLTSSRDEICQTHDLLIRKSLFVAYAHACLYEYLQKKTDISLIPRDYYQTSQHYQYLEHPINLHVEAINTCLKQEDSKGQWDKLSFDFEYYFEPGVGRERVVKLLTRIDYYGSTLAEAVKKGIDAGVGFVEMLEEAKKKQLVEQEALTANMVILQENDLDKYKKTVRDIVKWVYKATGCGFYDVVFYRKDEPVGATAGSARMQEDGSIEWKLRLNVYKHTLWRNVFEKNAPFELVYTNQRDTLFELIAHEYAHVLEYLSNLEECLKLLDEIQMQDTVRNECKKLIKAYFISVFSTDDGILSFENATIINDIKKIFDTIEEQNAKKALILSSMANHFNVQFNWTHNTDEKLDRSFINIMRRIIEVFLRSKRLKELPEIVSISCLLQSQGLPQTVVTTLLDKMSKAQQKIFFDVALFRRLSGSPEQIQYMINVADIEEVVGKWQKASVAKSKFIQNAFVYFSVADAGKILGLLTSIPLSTIEALDVLIDFTSSELSFALHPLLEDSNALRKKIAELFGDAKRKEMEQQLEGGLTKLMDAHVPSTSPKSPTFTHLVEPFNITIECELEELGLMLSNLGELLHNKAELCEQYHALKKRYEYINTRREDYLHILAELRMIKECLSQLRKRTAADVESALEDKDEAFRSIDHYIHNGEEVIKVPGNGCCAYSAFGIGLLFLIVNGGIQLDKERHKEFFALLTKDFPGIINIHIWLINCVRNFNLEKLHVQSILSNILRKLSVSLIKENFHKFHFKIKDPHHWLEEIPLTPEEYEQKMLERIDGRYHEWGSILELTVLAKYFNVYFEARGLIPTNNDLCGAPKIIFVNVDGSHFDYIVRTANKDKATLIAMEKETPDFIEELDSDAYYLYHENDTKVRIVTVKKIKELGISDLNRISYVATAKQRILHRIFSSLEEQFNDNETMKLLDRSKLRNFLSYKALEDTPLIETNNPHIFGWKISDGHACFLNLGSQARKAITKGISFVGAETQIGISERFLKPKSQYKLTKVTFFNDGQVEKRDTEKAGEDINKKTKIKIDGMSTSEMRITS